MTDDLIQRLRFIVLHQRDPSIGLLLNACADEIERLRSDIKTVQRAFHTGVAAAKSVAANNLAEAERLNAQSNPGALESERAANAALTDEIQRLRESTESAQLACLADIRWAVGDNGTRMQGELVEYIKEIVAERDALRARIDGAPIAIMDTRDMLGICAPTEDDFPGLIALRGKRVRLVLVEDE